MAGFSSVITIAAPAVAATPPGPGAAPLPVVEGDAEGMISATPGFTGVPAVNCCIGAEVRDALKASTRISLLCV